jgi:AraC-like DNA-binding protein
MALIGSTRGILAGFHVARPAAGVPELHDLGDEWLPEQRPMSWHSHAEWELYLQVGGTTVRAARERAWDMRPGDAFLAPPAASHRVVNRGTARQHNRYVRFALEPIARRHRAIAPLWRFARCRHLPEARVLEEPFAQLVREVRYDRPLREEGLRLALDALIIAASRLLDGSAETPIVPVPEAVLEAQELLDTASERAWPLRELAARVRVSPSHLLALFRRHLGVAPHRYLVRRRIERARRMLDQTDAPITEIALEVGFASSQHFAKAFKAQTGRSAREHRRAAQR